MTGSGLVVVNALQSISTIPAASQIVYTCPVGRYAYAVINLEANTTSSYILLNTQFGTYSIWKFTQTHSQQGGGGGPINWPHAHRVIRMQPGMSLEASSIDLNLFVIEEEFVS